MIYRGDEGSGALFSDCERYRLALWRKLLPYPGRALISCGLNPSTADENRNDPTVSWEIRWAMRRGFTRLVKLNLFDYRATDPRALKSAARPLTPQNNEVIEFFALMSRSTFVATWGNHGSHRNRSGSVLALLFFWSVPVYCFHINKTGEPAHPLYLPAATELQRFR